MQIQKPFLYLIVLTMVFVGCEIPKQPDFKTSHKVEAPLMYNKSFQFMGDSTALIDTTSSDLDSLFTIESDNSIIISKEEDFDFGDLNDAIPTINVDPTSFESQVGEIEITDFSSSDGALGEANIQEVTGQDPNLVPAGTPIPAGNNNANPVRLSIGANTDFFRSATIKDGVLEIEVQNSLGFDFQTAEIQVIDTVTNSAIGASATFSAANGNQLVDGATQTASIAFTEGDRLVNLGVEIVISWDAFNFPSNPGALTVNSVVGNGLVASQVQAALDEQDFSTTSTATFSDEEFVFNDPNHFVRLKSGEVIIAPIENQLEFDIDLVITFTDIQSCPASAASSNPFVSSADPLVISYTGNNRIERASSTDEAIIDLSGCEIRANGNEVSYEINSSTENTKNAPAGERIRVINENQSITSSVEISNLTIDRATGIVKQQVVLLNDDEGSDEVLSLFNDNEAEITEIDGLDELSRQLENLNFTNPTLSINYTTNVSVPTTIYGAFVGTNGNGEQVFLRGTAGDFTVSSTDPINGLNIRPGEPLNPEQMIKFSLAENPNGDNITSSILFDKDGTNIDDFLNNLPSDIRFIGKAVINEDEQEATIIDPLNFDPKISIDIPLAFSTPEAATYTDTVAQDLADLPSTQEGTSGISEGRIVIEYENGLPLGFNLDIMFLDENYNPLSPTPVSIEDVGLMAAEVDGSGFSSAATSGSTVIALEASQLDQLYKTRYMKISAALNTKDGEEVRLRTTDSIQLSVRAELTIESEVN
ncbi:hypothetical protein [Gracilimonas tropica]|uniref:hypothetical protein n=1 Tax=Gracilimonas tropica TaxID=454600 RepID=UPI0012F934E3|nr:hypothetical protein [Gracilimonas tropica]